MEITDEYVREVYKKLQDNPYSAEIHFEAGKMYLEQGNLTSALRYFERAVELDSNLKEASDKIEEIKNKN
jgi:tetratricopeptide (TPR) repeat protein